MRWRMEWSDWQMILEIERTGSLTRASGVLNVNQSTLTRRLATIEGELGQELFIRSRRGMEPTPSAERLIASVRRAEHLLNDAHRRASWTAERLSGTVRVSCLEAVAHFSLLPAVPGLRACAPELVLEIVSDRDVADLEYRESDIGIRLVRPPGGDYVAKGIDSGPLRAFAASTLTVESSSPQAIPWISWDRSHDNEPEARWLRGQRIDPVLRCSRAPVMIEAARTGLGAVLLPRRFGERVEGLRELPVSGLPDESIVLWLVTHTGLRRQPIVDAVWRWLLATFEAEDDGGAGGSSS